METEEDDYNGFNGRTSSGQRLTLGTTSTVSMSNYDRHKSSHSKYLLREQEDTFNLRGTGGLNGGGTITPKLGAVSFYNKNEEANQSILA